LLLLLILLVLLRLRLLLFAQHSVVQSGELRLEVFESIVQGVR
jgi:hypothetical protein